MTKLMGIVNVTPDSFSGDGKASAQAALAHIDALIRDGADYIDIGAESTRPGARLLTPNEEWQRLEPVMEALAERNKTVTFSIDTRHAAVARKALAAGCSWLNDVSGGSEPKMIEFARESGATLVVMHALSIPADTRITLPQSADPVQAVMEWGEKLLTKLEKAGVERSQIVLDPGIGFGKTREQSVALMRGVPQLKSLKIPLLVGHSRKSFLALFTEAPAAGRDLETILFSSYLAQQHVDFIRVHDIAGHRRMLTIRKALA